MPSAELRLFISSTFRDLQEEREHLVKKIFPEIRALCRERGITFTEVDLRWGLTHDEGDDGRIIRTCLEEIDRCRPYFIGILGNRYGHVPDVAEIQKDPELIRLHPWIEPAVLDGMSITEMEMTHGVLNEPVAATRARFYFRRERASLATGVADGETLRLGALKDRVRASGVCVQEFRDPGSLGEMVYDDLIEIIRSDFADATPPTPLEQERTRHAAFAASRRHAYIPNAQYLERLSVWYTTEEPPVVLYAESGSGKSSLVSFWCERLRRSDPNTFIVEHYVGIGASDTDHLGLIRHIAAEIKERLERDEELPSTPEEIERGLGQWLGYASHELKKRSERMVLVLDGLNQLTGQSLNLLWIPDVISPEIRLIVTTTVEETLVKLRKRGWQELGMQPLTEPEREAVVVRFLSEYHKTLPPELVRQIATDPKCAHPLFLRTLLEELRVYGQHDRIESHVERLLECTGTEDLFQRVLERMEDDYSLRTVRDVMSLVCASRGGLSEEELAELTSLSRLKLSTMLLGLDYHLVRHEGLVTFFHDYLRRAVAKRYRSDESSRRETHKALARYFERLVVTLRSTRELLHALEALGQHDGLHRELARIERFELLWESDRFEVLTRWANCDNEVVVEAYRESLQEWEQRETAGAQHRATVLGRIAELHEDQGRWSESERMGLQRLEILRGEGDRSQEAEAMSDLSRLTGRLGRGVEAERFAREAETIAREIGNRLLLAYAVGTRGTLHEHRGEYDDALKCLREQEAIARELGHRRSIATAVGNRGIVHTSRGEYAEALECFREQEAIVRELGHRRSIATAVGNRGVVHADRGESAEALACYREQEALARELGDRDGIATAVGNRGLRHADRGEYADALACYNEQEAIARELGDRHGIRRAVGHRGALHLERGEYAEALECFREQEAIAREQGDQRGIGIVVGNRGSVHASRGEYAEALNCLRMAAIEHRAIGFRYGLTYWLSEEAGVLIALAEAGGEMPVYLRDSLELQDAEPWQSAALRRAYELARECVLVSQELSKADTLLAARIELARIDAAEGKTEDARERLVDFLKAADTDHDRAGYHYWLWKICGSDDHRAAALRLYRSLFEQTPKGEYRSILDEFSRHDEPENAAGTATESPKTRQGRHLCRPL